MKYLSYTGLILSSLLFFVSCSNNSKKGKQEKEEKNSPVLTQEVDELEHEINEPFLYPFGLELSEMEATGYRESCGGDCCSGVKALEKGEYAIIMDTSDCWEYGYNEEYLLFRGDELIAYHEKSFSMGKIHDMVNIRNRVERTIDFENEKVFVRRDTVRNDHKKWINKEFIEENFSSASYDEVQRYVFDPRESISFTKDNTFLLNRSASEGVSSPVILFHSLSSNEYDIELIDAYNLQDIGDRESKGVPKDAVFAYSTWYAGGGDLLYGKLNDGILQVYLASEEGITKDISPYELILEVDPDLEIPSPNHYIVFNSEKKGNNKLMLGMDEKEQVLYAKYEGQSRQIQLKKVSDSMDGKKIIMVYQELIHGIPNGTYTHTHDGNWDYVTYKGKNGKEVKFTINHALTLLNSGDGYRDTPLF